MNRETIEKEAFKYGCENQVGPAMGGELEKGFIAGAQWRIDSVWHDVYKELPEFGRHVVNEDWFDFIANDEKDLNRIMKKYPFRRWAYINDLLPDGKEDER